MEIALLIISILLAFIVPLIINGPIAAKVYYQVVNSKSNSKVLMFWGVLLGLNFFGALLMGMTAGHAVPGPGACVCLVLPISSIVTISNMLRSRKDLIQSVENDTHSQRLFYLGIILIPALQIALPVIVWRLFAGPLCLWLYSLGFNCIW